MWLKYEELFPVTVTDASSHCSRQWKAFIYVLNGSSFNDTWMLRFLGDFFVIPDKFIILTIKLIKHSAHSNSFLREEIFWCHRNPSSAVSQAVPCPGSVSLLTRGGGKKQLWTRYKEHIEIGILGFESNKFSLPGSGSGIGQQQPLSWRWVWSCRRASGQKDALGCHLRLLLALLTAQLPFGVSVRHGFGRWSAVVRG